MTVTRSPRARRQMRTYLVESAVATLGLGPGRVSVGIQAERYNCFLHLLDLEPREVAQLGPVFDRRGQLSAARAAPTETSPWWFVCGSPKAHWPGRSDLRARLRGDQPTPLDRELVDALRAEIDHPDGAVPTGSTRQQHRGPGRDRVRPVAVAAPRSHTRSTGATSPNVGADDDSELHAPSLPVRHDAASRFRVFPFPVRLGAMAADWQTLRDAPLDEGDAWPERLVRLARRWPEHAFGVANAPVLVLWHRPGVNGLGRGGTYFGPKYPVLGGINHLHVPLWAQRYPDPSWTGLTMHLDRAFRRAKVPNPWQHVMVACLIPEPDITGRRLEAANREAIRPGGRLDTILDMTRPLVILACGKPVRDYLPRWSASTRVPHVEPIYVDHPSIWIRKRNGEVGMGEEVVSMMARALRAVR